MSVIKVKNLNRKNVTNFMKNENLKPIAIWFLRSLIGH